MTAYVRTFFLLLLLSFSSYASDVHVKLQLRWLHQFQFAGFYAAKEQGYYRDAGLDVEFVEAQKYNIFDGVESGEMQFGVCGSGLVQERLEGRPFVALAVIFQNSPYIWLTKTEENITKPSDFVGKTVMVTKDIYDSSELLALFDRTGVSKEKINFIETSYNYKDLIEGKTSALNAYTTNEPFFLSQENVPFTIISPSDYGLDFYGDTLFTSEMMLEHHPDRVKAFRDASLRGWEYALMHKEEMVNLILAKYNTQNKTRAHLMFEANELKKLSLYPLVDVGHMNLKRWEHIAQIFKSGNKVDSVIDLSGFLYDPEADQRTLWIKRVIIILVILLAVLAIREVVQRRYMAKLKHRVEDRTKELKALNETLEQKVQERTLSLQNMTDRYRFVVDGSLDGIWDWNIATGEVYYSPQWKAMLGYQDHELENIYGTWESHIHEDDKARVIQDIQRCLKGEENNFENIHRLRHKDGHWITVRDRAHLYHDNEGNASRMAGFHTDITEQVRAEEELKFNEQIILQQSKMAAMGEMLENIAHQWRQPLNIIGLNITRLETDKLFGKQSDEVFTNTVHNINEQIHYMSNTIDDFRKFFKQEKKEELFELDEAMNATLTLIETKIKSKQIILVKDIDQVTVFGFRNALIQVFINILNNAIFQLETLDISTHRLLFINIKKRADKIMISVKDSGGGIDLTVEDKLFEPYFTTKHKSIGTGIGLYMSYEIIVKHFGGSITAHNREFEHEGEHYTGAEFTIEFPLRENP